MSERAFQRRDRSNPDTLERLPVFTDVAHTWAIKAGYATELENGDLLPTDNIDTIGETVVTIGNSERRVEDFALVHKIVSRMSRGGQTASHTALATMVETAEFMFAPMEDLPTTSRPLEV